MPRLPLDEELAAVRALAGRLGLGGAEPVVLKRAKHTTLRLGPLVARVQSAPPLAAARQTMAREVAVAAHLAGLRAPAVRPSVDPPPGPYEIGDCVVSLWSFVDHRAAGDADAAAAGAALGRLRAALVSYAGPLPDYLASVTDCAALAEDAAAMAAAPADDRALLARLVRAGLERLPSDAGRWIALHGDAHLGNVMITAAGAIWADLEAVCRGPPEWDLCNKPAAFRVGFERCDRVMLGRLSALRRACVAVWCWADAGRSAEIRAAAALHTAWLRRQAARFA